MAGPERLSERIRRDCWRLLGQRKLPRRLALSLEAVESLMGEYKSQDPRYIHWLVNGLPWTLDPIPGLYEIYHADPIDGGAVLC